MHCTYFFESLLIAFMVYDVSIECLGEIVCDDVLNESTNTDGRVRSSDFATCGNEQQHTYIRHHVL